MGSQLRLRFEQEAKLLRKSVAQVARQEQRIQARESEIKNLEALLETEAGMKRAAEEKSAGLNQMVEQRCAKMDARLDAMSIDFDEELYPHMLIAIAGRRWVIGRGLRLATMKCVESLEMRQAFADVVSAGIAKGMSEGLKHGVERTVESLKAYDLEAEAKFAAALQLLKDLKLPLLDQLEGLKDAPMDVLMASLYLEDDTEEDAPQFIRDLRPSSSQLCIPVYPEVRDPRNPWACKEEIQLADAIAVNISRAEQKKRNRIVCQTHGVGSAHHAKSDRVPVSAPTVVPQGLALFW
nr:transposase (putative), gypsy type [Tanacetum cinerariifolium]